jgi:hypothetical protein
MATQNALFAVIAFELNAGVDTRIASLPNWPSQIIKEDQWLVIAPNATTTKELSDKLGFVDNGTNGIVLRVENYYGRYQRSLWEWIATKQGADLGTSHA